MGEQPSIPIAIVGMSCRFAGGATDPEKLWQLCEEGRTGWSEIPSDRFNINGHYHPRPDHLNTTNVKGACFLEEDIAAFDATFFGLSAETAACLDPQFRLMLESTYEAFENAGLSLQEVNGSNTSVYAGSFFKDYHDAGLRDVTTLPRSFLIGVGSAMASNRLSHYFDLRGASMSIDTGCSTTMTALHQACNDLRNHESSMSVVSGGNLILNPDMFITMSSVQLISKDGKSFTFDSRANGYGRGEGVATVVLKRLDDALRDGDPIQAIIKESALNQDGKTETITTPSQEAQIELIKRVYKKAGLDPKDTGYFEAHGTGTPTGDPLEVGAIAAAFKDSRPRDRPLAIGSVKPNIGHTECASGLASIIKVVKALEKGKIPPSANLEKLNPRLKLEEWNLKVPRVAEPWPEAAVRRASVNNFGYGGANSHIILEHYQPTSADSDGSPTTLSSKVLMLSAKDETAATTMVENLRDYLLSAEIEDEASFMRDLAYTLGQRRTTTFPWVAATTASSVSEIIRAIDGNRMKPRRTQSPLRLGFVFTGQGAQWWAMGRELIAAYPVFRDTIVEADGYLREFGAKYSLLDELHRDEQTTRVNEATLGQPVCVAVQVALVRLLESWGVVPSAVTSHSSGEIASAFAAGVLSLRNAMGVVYARGTLAADVAKYSTLGRGGMIAVGLGVEAAEKYVERVSAGKVVVACRNSPASVTVSGDIAGIEEIEKLLKEDNVFARQLKVPTGYHSHHMQPIAEPYLKWLQANITPEPSMKEGLIYSSPTTGGRMTDAQEIGAPEHWVQSLTNPVLFTEAFTNMCFAGPGEPCDVDYVIEIGAHAALSGPIQDIKSLDAFQGTKIGYSSCLLRKKDAVETAQALACDLIHNGYQLNMGNVNLTPRGNVLTDLPKYAWNHQNRHWYEPRMNRAHRMLSEAPHDLLGSPLTGGNRINPSWRHVIKASSLPWIRDHGLQGTVVYPGAGFICMAIEGLVQAEKSSGGKPISGYRLRDIDILQALVIPEGDDGIEVQLSMRPCGDKAIYAKGWKEFQIFSVTHDDKWSEHCRGLIRLERDDGRHKQRKGLAAAKPIQSKPLSTELELPQSVILEAWGESKLLTDKLVQQYGADGYLKTILPKQDQLCVALTVEAFKELGCDLAAAQPGDTLEHVPHIPTQARFAKYLYSILESAHLVDVKDGVITRTDAPLLVRPSDVLLQDLIRSHPEHSRPNELAHLTGTHLAGILTGKEDGIKLIFGTERGRDLVSGVYADFPLNKVGYHQMGDFLTRILSKVPRHPGQGPLKILEMGAGTGATTKKLVPLLAELGVPVEFTFTDLAPSFVAAARKEFKKYPFMKFRAHDIEKAPAADLMHSQHIVIASNAVHATRSLPDSTANIRKMLRPDGLLLLLELTGPMYWCDIIFGVFEGWWLFEDGRTRAIAPPERWEKDLHRVGYGHVDWSDGHLPEIQCERVIIATASGEQFERLPLPPAPQQAPPDYNHDARRAATDQYVRKYTADFSLPASSNDAVDPASPTVLITGATGSLGAHMAAHYAGLPTVRSVICLNRRSGSDPKQRQLRSMEAKGIKLDERALSKLLVYETDTAKPCLGLPLEHYAALLPSLTHIIHNAWPMNAKRPLKGFERQFQVMRNLLDLAADTSAHRTASAKVTFQLISSIATVGHHPFHAGTPHIPEERMTIESVLPNGYGDAKFVCELMLDATLHTHPSRFRAMAVRLGQVAGSTASGYWNTMEHLSFLLRSSQTLGALPALTGPLSWTPVDAVAAAAADLALLPPAPHPVYHIDNPVRQPWEHMLPVLAAQLGIDPAAGIVPFREWIARVRAHPGPVEWANPAAKLVDFLEADFERMSCGGVLLETERSREHSPTMRAVGPVSEEVVARYISAWREVGFLD
ncbi:Beta-ketoacyl synthase [Macrophomina phaseolina MS6]|uniref:Beta-ketoacyl synthase n=1 Tax=Macrophomina phaseolina (strain MS6) TaxID=1126212 RepID=K2RMK4_MACPH|nr:Beta-ketoacyl synthase [Macrophomina phaseolina MS6]